MTKQLFLLSAAAMLACAVPAEAATQCGKASWYSHAGKRTANGEIANPAGFTAAHRTLPFGTRVQVVNLHNGKSVMVRINDRGPFAGGRVIDLSKAAAAQIGLVQRGVGRVAIAPAGGGKPSCP